MRWKTRVASLVICVRAGLPIAQGQPTVIHESGPALPISAYVPRMPGMDHPPVRLALPPADPRLFAPAYPVRTPSMSPGPVVAKKVDLPQLGGHPFFLVGSDQASLRWLGRYAARLKAIGAAGLLVQAETASDVEAVRSLAQGIAMAPVNGDAIAKILGLDHYPALVSAGQIEQ